jgi:hypothetical protein
MTIHLDWHTPFMIYLRTGGLPEDKDEQKILRRWAGHYTLVGEGRMGYSCDASPWRRGTLSFKTSTQEFAEATRVCEHLWAKHIGKGFTGQRSYLMLTP